MKIWFGLVEIGASYVNFRGGGGGGLIHMVEISPKSEVFDFSGGRSPLLGGFTIVEGS